MRDARLTIPAGELTLEAALATPDDPAGAPYATVVMCHPHPQYGGSMDNNVVAAVAQGLASRGLACLRFNFRGVGGSTGQHGDGSEERDDVRAAIAFARDLPEVDGGRLALAGYSFGAGVAAHVAGGEAEDGTARYPRIGEGAVPALALVSMPLQAAADSPLVGFAHPLLLLHGDSDQAATPELLHELAGLAPGPAEVQIVAGADHFWGGFERTIADAVGAFFAGALA